MSVCFGGGERVKRFRLLENELFLVAALTTHGFTLRKRGEEGENSILSLCCLDRWAGGNSTQPQTVARFFSF